MEDAMAAMNAVNMLVPTEAPSGSYTTRLTTRTLGRHPGTARTWEWCNDSRMWIVWRLWRRISACSMWPIVEGFLGGRTRIYQWRIVIFRRAVTMDLQTKRDVDCLHGLT